MKNISLLLFCILMMSRCQIANFEDVSTFQKIAAEGSIMIKTLNVTNFNFLQIVGSGIINLEKGNENKVVLEDFENFLQFYDVKVDNQVLIIKRRDSIFLQNSRLKINITKIEQLSGINSIGSAKIDIQSGIENISNFELIGSGEINVLNNAFTNDYKLKVTGSGKVDLIKLTSIKSVCNISGSGDSKVKVSDSLNVELSGSCSLSYLGDPKVNSKITGTGRVIKL